ISGTGCRPPLMAPLASGMRIDGEPAGTDAANLICAPREEGITIPTQNVALNGALALDALYTTAENITDARDAGIYRDVLPPGETQISLMVKANPKFVSIEFGANENLGARNGVVIPGITQFPAAAWRPLYTQIVDRAAAVAKYGVLVGLI